MLRTQIYLTGQEKSGLDFISHETGTSQSALIRKAIDKLIEEYSDSNEQAEENFLAGCGIWAKRPESDFDYKKLRDESDRDFS